MGLESILIKFLLLVSLLFFLPKILNRFYKVPSPITEILLGIILGIAFPSFFYNDDMVRILATLGIVTLFVYSGMEIDSRLFRKNKKYFIENTFRHLLVFFVISYLIYIILKVPFVNAALIAVAITTPSASYIISSVSKNDENRKWIESKALFGEILGLLLLVVFLRINEPANLFFTITFLVLLIVALPYILGFLYNKIFKSMVGTEFSFIFVVALIAAFATEFIGVHFLVGAFIAGVVSRNFLIRNVKKNENGPGNKLISETFGFFAVTFIPFYFFSAGLRMNLKIINFENFLIALFSLLIVSSFRVLTLSLHRKLRMKERFRKSFEISYQLIPTFVFTFVIAEILLEGNLIDESIFGVLMIYGLLSGVFSFVLNSIVKSRKSD